MKENIKYKLETISNIWNHFIWEYKFCQKRIKFIPDIKTNYFGEILGYFDDTLDIIFEKREIKNHTDRFSNHISLLQSIYIQQDFIEEMLIIFKCGINKGKLKKDTNYNLNREIRNELIGHPIRKYNGEFISSTLFGYNFEFDSIVYLRYHKDKNFEFEKMSFLISDIIDRHINFLNTYFDKILQNLKNFLYAFNKVIIKIEKLIEKKDFQTILNIISVYFESIFKYNYAYDKDSLLKIHSIRKKHKRYENFIDCFYQDLKVNLTETRNYVIELFEHKKEFNNENLEKPLFDILFVKKSQNDKTKKKTETNYNYELGKISTKRNQIDFEFFGGMLKSKCSENELVLAELEHMKNNIYNEIEYYSAYRLISKELRND